MRDIRGAEFRFAKTLTLPFFGSGMVELPPEGAKRVKNSRKMQMVFFVFYGRVTVDVGTPTTSFSIGKGGMWHVPRGKKSLFFSLLLCHSTFYKHFTSVTFFATLNFTGCRVFWNISSGSTPRQGRLIRWTTLREIYSSGVPPQTSRVSVSRWGGHA